MKSAIYKLFLSGILMFSFISLNLAQDQINDSLQQKKDTATATLKTAPKTGKTDDAYFHWETPVLAPVNIDSIQQQKMIMKHI